MAVPDEMGRGRAGLPAPGPEKAEFVRALFDTIAPAYDLMNRVMTAGLLGRWRRSFAGVTGLSPGEAALDVCCGTGELALLMARQVGPQGKVSGVDFSPRMLALARKKAEKTGWPVEFLLADALELPFPDASFHCAAIGFALRNVNDPRACLAEMSRVTRAGGRVVVLEICRPTAPWVRAWFYPYFYGLVPVLGLVAGFRASGLRPYSYLPRSLAYLPSLEELAALMRAVGLAEVRYRVLPPGVVSLHWGTRSAPVRGDDAKGNGRRGVE